MPRKAAIILAGGKAKRFQTDRGRFEDKALAKLRGKPLLIHIVENVREMVEKIIIVVNEEARAHRYFDLLQESSIEEVELCVDEEFENVGGPLPAIATGLKHTNANYCVVMPCDAPLIKSALIDHLIQEAKGSKAAVPIWPDGTIEPLMVAYEGKASAQVGELLCKLERKRPDDMLRGSSKVTFVSVASDLKDLDPELESFININFRGDLTKLPTRPIGSGPIRETFCLNLGAPHVSELKKLEVASECYHKGGTLKSSDIFTNVSQTLEEAGLSFWAGVARENEGKCLFDLSEKFCPKEPEVKRTHRERGKAAFAMAARDYESEAGLYERSSISLLAKHARMDGQWCRDRI